VNEKKPKKLNNKELEEKIKLLEEESLRAKADLINYRKRKDEETSSLLKYGNSILIEELLLTIDNFERALNIKEENLSPELKNFLMGFKMIYTSLNEMLLANGVKEIDAINQKFDSKLHNCIFTESDPSYEDDIVLDVITKGYTYYDKVLRCASVKVNKIENNKKEKENENNE